jgi:hypothetical protein
MTTPSAIADRLEAMVAAGRPFDGRIILRLSDLSALAVLLRALPDAPPADPSAEPRLAAQAALIGVLRDELAARPVGEEGETAALEREVEQLVRARDAAAAEAARIDADLDAALAANARLERELAVLRSRGARSRTIAALEADLAAARRLLAARAAGG